MRNPRQPIHRKPADLLVQRRGERARENGREVEAVALGDSLPIARADYLGGVGNGAEEIAFAHVGAADGGMQLKQVGATAWPPTMSGCAESASTAEKAAGGCNSDILLVANHPVGGRVIHLHRGINPLHFCRRDQPEIKLRLIKAALKHL